MSLIVKLRRLAARIKCHVDPRQGSQATTDSKDTPKASLPEGTASGVESTFRVQEA